MRQEVLGSFPPERAREDIRPGIVKSIQKRLSNFRHGAKPKEGPEESIIPLSTEPEDREISPEDYTITDILPHDPNDRRPVVTYPMIDQIMKVAEEDEDIKGKIYRLESGPEDIYQKPEERKYLYYQYYAGQRDDEGKPAKPENSTFYIAKNAKGDLLAVTTVRWKDVDFIKRGRTAYRERTIVLNPRLRDYGIATGLGIQVLDDIFYRSEKYDGKPATRVESSIYTDRPAGRHDINHNYLTLLGYSKYGDPIWVKDGKKVDYRLDDKTRQVQPYDLTLEDWERARPNAIEHLAVNQPELAKKLENEWPRLRASL